MAGSISYNLTITAQNNYSTVSRNPSFFETDWNDGKFYAQTATLSTVWEPLHKGDDITNVGLTYLHNIGDNDIDVSFDSGVTNHLVMGSGEFQLFRLTQNIEISSIQVKSVSGSNLEYCIFSN